MSSMKFPHCSVWQGNSSGGTAASSTSSGAASLTPRNGQLLHILAARLMQSNSLTRSENYSLACLDIPRARPEGRCDIHRIDLERAPEAQFAYPVLYRVAPFDNPFPPPLIDNLSALAKRDSEAIRRLHPGSTIASPSSESPTFWAMACVALTSWQRRREQTPTRCGACC